jgi:hypothetical protein
MHLSRKKQLTIPLPNATALLLNSSAIAFTAARTIRVASGIDKSLQTDVSFQSDKEAFDYIERMIEAVVLAFTALEAFVNETIPEDFVYAHHVRSEVVLEAANKSTTRGSEMRVAKGLSVLAGLQAAQGGQRPSGSHEERRPQVFWARSRYRVEGCIPLSCAAPRSKGND